MAALKIWNGRDPNFPNTSSDKPWCVPRKGTTEHAEVKEIMRTGKLPGAAVEEPKPKAKRKFRIVPGEDKRVVKVKKFLTTKVRNIKGKKEAQYEVEGAKCYKQEVEARKEYKTWEDALAPSLQITARKLNQSTRDLMEDPENEGIFSPPDSIKHPKCKDKWKFDTLVQSVKTGVRDKEEAEKPVVPKTIKIKRKPVIVEEKKGPADESVLVEFLKLYEAEAPKTVKENYSSLAFLQDIYWAHLIKKYQNNCYVITEEPTKLPFGTVIDNISVGLDITTTSRKSVKMPSLVRIDEIGKVIRKCLEDGVKIIVIPLSVPGHANMLLYRAVDNTLDRFEPQYPGLKRDTTSPYAKVDGIVEKILDKWKKSKYVPLTATYKKASDLCPNPKGFQAHEIDQFEALFGKGGPGFCGMWSLFFAETALKFPNIPSDRIYQKGVEELRKKGNIGFYNHIANYTNEVEKGIANILGKDFTFGSLNNKKRTKGNKAVINEAIREVLNWWEGYQKKILRNNEGVEKIEGGCVRYVRHGKDCV